jgi:hypothetical protein
MQVAKVLFSIVTVCRNDLANFRDTESSVRGSRLVRMRGLRERGFFVQWQTRRS